MIRPRFIVTVTLASAALGSTGGWLVANGQHISSGQHAKTEITSIRAEILGYTKYTDYVTAGKRSMTEQAMFLAANVVRNYTLVEHLETGRLGLTSKATVIVEYSVEYSFGYDLQPDSFDLRASPTGLEIRIGRPVLIASPAVTPYLHLIPERGLLTNEREAIIGIHHRLPAIARARGTTMLQEEAIRALCEKQLVAFLRDYLSRQPGVVHVPAIAVVYR